MSRILPADYNLFEALLYAKRERLMLLTDGRRTVLSRVPITGFIRICAGIKS